MSYLNEVASLRSLRRAWLCIKKKKHVVPGVDGITVENFSKSLDSSLKSISNDLKAKKYTFQKVKLVNIPKGDKKLGKTRPIGIYIIRDKIVQKSLQNFLEQEKNGSRVIFPDVSNSISIGFISNKHRSAASGVKLAINRIKQFQKQGYCYATTADIKDFFKVIDRKKIEQMIISKLNPDKSLNKLIKDCLNPTVIQIDRYTSQETALPSTNEGVAQGSVLSPLFSNIYMSEFDKEVEKENIPAIRYADDFIFFSKSKSQQKKQLVKIKKILKSTAGLEFHPDDTEKGPRRYNMYSFCEYLGIKFRKIRQSNRWEIGPTPKKISVEKDRIVENLTLKNVDNFLETILFLNNNIKGWFSTYESSGCTKKILTKINHEIRDIYETQVASLLVNRNLMTKRLGHDDLVFLGVLQKINVKRKRKK